MNYRFRGTRASLALLCTSLCLAAGGPCAADAVTDWNAALTRAIKTAAVPPGRQSRQAAVVHAAIFDAVNGIARKYEPYLADEQAPGGARQEAAAVEAAYTALVGLFPAQKSAFDEQLARSLSKIPGSAGNSQSIARGRAWGKRVALEILAQRSTDGYNAVLPPFFGSTEVGVWRPVPPNGSLPAVFQELALMKPFAMTHPAQFRPEPPPALTTAAYAADVNEVKLWGSAASPLRTPAQTEAALLWHAVDAADENDSLRALLPAGGSLVDNARLFALMNIAGADGLIYVMDAKRAHNFWRPYHAIRLADLDGNPLTEADPSWAPLIGTPRHQEYPSAHSAFTVAHLRVLALLLGDDTPITIQSTGRPGSTLTYARLSEAVEGVQNARVWGGIHFRTAVRTSDRDGSALAEYVVANFLRPRGSRGRGK